MNNNPAVYAALNLLLETEREALATFLKENVKKINDRHPVKNQLLTYQYH